VSTPARACRCYREQVPPDATATKARILDAATQEFAQYGLAGARVDRVADTAAVNKRSIYVHFGNKEELFDLIVARVLTEMSGMLPFTADDLPDYGARLFDYIHQRPDVLRITTWAQLERPEPTPAEIDAYRPKVAAIVDAQKRGVVPDGHDPVDLLAFVVSTATAWANASPALRVIGGSQPTSHARLVQHRAALIQALRGVVAATT
jgi:AcrR family transcriptional regulator